MATHRRLFVAFVIVIFACTIIACAGSPDRKSNTPVAIENQVQVDASQHVRDSENAFTERMNARLTARAKAEADAAAKDVENWKVYDAEVTRLQAEHRERVEQYKSEKVIFDKAQTKYQKVRFEYDAAVKVSFARGFLEEARKSNSPQSRTSREIADRRLREVISSYPNTQGAKDALALLSDDYVPLRPIPVAPVVPIAPKEPKLVLPSPPTPVAVVYPAEPDDTPVAQLKSEREIPDNDISLSRNGTYQTPVQISGGKTVYVKGYVRKDGTYVQPHTRAAPGSGARRR